MQLFKKVKFPKIAEKTIKALFHTFWHLIGTLLPLIIILILSLLFLRFDQIRHFIDEGDFCLFSAAILTPASYLLSQFSRDENKIVRRWPSSLYACSITIILISATLFAGVFIKSIFASACFNYTLFERLSTAMLLISVVIFFITQKLNLKYEEPPNSAEIEKEEIDKLESEFDKLPG